MNFTDRFLAIVTFIIGGFALVYVVRTWKPVAAPAPHEAVAAARPNECVDLLSSISERR